VSRTSRREMRELLERAGRRPVPRGVGAIDSSDPSIVDDDESTRSLVEAPGLAVATAEMRTNGASRGGRSEMVALLEAAGSRRVPPVDPAFLDRTEARILGADVDSLAPRRERRSRRPAVIASVAAAIAAFIAVGALAGLFGGGDEGTEVAVWSAVDTIVVLPDGDRVEAIRGLELPDGTVIRTGPNGFARIDGVTLGPDSEAIVEEGRLRVVSRAAPTTLASTSKQQAPADGPAPPVVAAPVPDAGAPPAPQQAPPAPSAEAPAPTNPPSAEPSPPPPPLLPLPEPILDLPLLDDLRKLLPLL